MMKEDNENGIQDVSLSRVSEGPRILERLSVRIRCTMEFQQWLLKSKKYSSTSSFDHFLLHYEQVVYSAETFGEFIFRVERDHATHNSRSANFQRKKQTFLNSNQVKTTFSRYMGSKRAEQTRKDEKENKNILFGLKDKTNTTNEPSMRLFRSYFDILDVWSSVNFCEFEEKKIADEEAGTVCFIPFLRLGESNDGMHNSHLYCLNHISSEGT